MLLLLLIGLLCGACSAQTLPVSRERLATLVRMVQVTYPEADLQIFEDDAEREWKARVDAENERFIAEHGWAVEDVFLGDRAGDDKDRQVGLHAKVFRRAEDVVVAFQGSFSIADYALSFLWYKPWFVARHADRSRAVWKHRTGTAAVGEETPATYFFSRVFVEALLAYEHRRAINRLAETTADLVSDRAQLEQDKYLALAKVLLRRTLRDVGPGASVSLTGHSIGGTYATLLSIWAYEELGVTLQTTTFGALGIACMAAERLHMAARSEPYGHIVNIADELDPFPMVDSHPGAVVYFSSDRDASVCSTIMGHGITYIGNVLDTAFARRFKSCRALTHGIFHYWHAIVEDDDIWAQGSPRLEVREQDNVDYGDGRRCPGADDDVVFWPLLGAHAVVPAVALLALWRRRRAHVRKAKSA